MRILATYNIKGGVGKTAAAANLAALAARDGARTLLWDLDPQGSATFYFRIRARVKGGGKKLLRGRATLDTLVKGTDYPNLDLLPADFSYRHMDRTLDSVDKPSKRLMLLMRPLAEEYDYVFLDCPPSISLVSENVFRAADALIVPMIPTTLSLRTFRQLDAFLDRRRFRHTLVLPFFSMVDRRKKLHRETVETLPKTWPDMLENSIPYSSEIERNGIVTAGQRGPLNGQPARAFGALWAEILARLASA